VEYLRANRAASDTLRGIRDWWLRDVRTEPLDPELLEALEALADSGAVRRIENPDGSVLWCAGPRLDG
jgi:hypothetical protein